MRAVVALFALTLVRPSFAGTGERDAKALFRGGKQLVESGDYAGAADMFREAYARFPNPTILINLGAVLEALDKPVEAAAVYEKFLLDPNSPRAKKAEIGRKLADLDARLGRVKVDVDPPDARVTFDGEPFAGSPPFAARATPGGHAIVGEKDGFSPSVETVQIIAGQERVVSLKLRRSSEAPAAAAVPPPAAAAGPPPPVAAASLLEPESAAPAEPAEVVTAVHAEPETPGDTFSHAGQVGLLVRGEFSARAKDGIPTMGVTYGVTPSLELSGAALLAEEIGFRPGASWLFVPTAPLKPSVELGVPVFFADGTRAGVHAGAGLTWDLHRNLGAGLGAAVEYFPSVPDTFNRTIVVLAAGVHARAF